MIYENESSDRDKNRFLDLKFIACQKISVVSVPEHRTPKDSIQVFINNPKQGYISSVSPVMHFGLGDIDVDSGRPSGPVICDRFIKAFL
jgi:hypothetical protein